MFMMMFVEIVAVIVVMMIRISIVGAFSFESAVVIVFRSWFDEVISMGCTIMGIDPATWTITAFCAMVPGAILPFMSSSQIMRGVFHQVRFIFMVVNLFEIIVEFVTELLIESILLMRIFSTHVVIF